VGIILSDCLLHKIQKADKVVIALVW
jgi:hypothetical protein